MPPRRTTSALSVFVILLIAVLAFAACGDDEGSTTSKPDSRTATGDEKAKTTAGSEGKFAAVDADLKFVVAGVGSKDPAAPGVGLPANMACTKSIPASCRSELTCPAADGDEWQSEACTYLAEHLDVLFVDPPSGRMCTEIYGGPEIATVTGTIAGSRKVDTEFSRVNGCEIARWELHQALWGQQAPERVDGAAATCDLADESPDAAVSSTCDIEAPPGAISRGEPGTAPPAGSGAPPAIQPETHEDPPSAFR